MSLFSPGHSPCGECGAPSTIQASTGPVCAPCCPAGEKPGPPVVDVMGLVDEALSKEVPRDA